jgi:ppGpp synthetase/RelA/SpoT-type nucleotidyltranferase
MGLRMSRSAADRLGARLAHAEVPAAEDLALLAELQADHQMALMTVSDEIDSLFGVPAHTRGFVIQVAKRLKTANTLIDKRKRHSRLSGVQDVAGARLVVWNLVMQDQIVNDLRTRFRDARIQDRRIQPSHGYRAVHVIVTAKDLPVEIQVRTAWQHAWADATEAVADAWGRGIRYGEPPLGKDDAEVAERIRRFSSWLAVAANIRELELVTERAMAAVEDAAQSGRSIPLIDVGGAPFPRQFARQFKRAHREFRRALASSGELGTAMAAAFERVQAAGVMSFP